MYTSSLIASPKRPSLPRITRGQSIYHYCSLSLYSIHYTLLVTSVPSDTPFPYLLPPTLPRHNVRWFLQIAPRIPSWHASPRKAQKLSTATDTFSFRSDENRKKGMRGTRKRATRESRIPMPPSPCPSDGPLFPPIKIHTPMRIKPDFQAKMHFNTNQLPMH